MASHRNTPQSVLDAPAPNPVNVYPQAASGSRGNAPFVGNVARDLVGVERRVSKSRSLGKKD